MRLEESKNRSVIVDIVVHVDVHTFYGVAQVARVLAEVDTAARDYPAFSDSRREQRRSYELRYFRVNSPPHTSILADPAWLAVFLGLIAVGISFVATYPQLKSNSREIYRDGADAVQRGKAEARNVVAAIGGISDHYKQQLTIGVELYLDQIAASSPDVIARFLRRASRVSNGLGARKHLPRVDVHRPDEHAG